MVGFYFSSCKEDENFVPLKIFSVDPVEVRIGDTVSIFGEGFSPGQQYNSVIFQGASSAVLPLSSSNTTALQVIVPEGAKSGSVTVNLFDEEIAESPVLSVLQPLIESISPEDGVISDTVFIRGSNFQPIPQFNVVRFSVGNNSFTTPIPAVGGSNGLIKVLVPPNAVSGPVRVGGFSGPVFDVKEPLISGITPEQGIVGDTITITGLGFLIDATTQVSFGGNVVSNALPGSTSRIIKALVPPGAVDGKVQLSYSTVTLESTTSFSVYPSITSISPGNGIAGTTVTINGFNFSTSISDNEVRLDGLKVVVTQASTTQLQFRIPAGATSGSISITVNGRGVTGPMFVISSDGTPVIFEVQPASGPVGSLIVINGDYFNPATVGNIVKFGGGVQGEVTTASATQLIVKVPVGATTGTISVTNDGKTGTGPLFMLTNRALPVIASINPSLAPHLSNITITGANFGEFQQDIRVQYNGCGTNYLMPIVSFSSTQIVATLPPTEITTVTATGTIVTPVPPCEGTIVVSLYNQQSNSETFTISGVPSITSLSASNGFSGSQLTLTGTNFHNINEKNIVTFSNGTVSETAIVVSDDLFQNTVTVFVPNLAAGIYNVSLTAFGNVSANTFTYEVKEQPVAVKNVFYAVNNVQVDPDGDGTTASGLRIEKQTFGVGSIQTVYERTPVSTLRAMAVDLVNNKVYYATTTRILGRNNINNSGDETLFTQSSPTTSINDITLDVTSGKLYWTTGNTVMRIGVAGGTSDPIVYTAAAGVVITAIVYEPTNSKLYLYEKTSTSSLAGDIVSINTDGTGRSVIVTGAANLFDLKIDVAEGKLFYTSSTSGSVGGTIVNIFQANLSGSGSPTLYLPFGGTTTVSGSGVKIAGISLDLMDKYVYFLANPIGASLGTGVYRMRYDGGNIPATSPPVAVERVYQVTGGSSPLGSGLSFAAGLALENGTVTSQRMRLALTMEFRNGE